MFLQPDLKLRMAQHLGFEVPETIITSSVAQAIDFRVKHGGIIMKPLVFEPVYIGDGKRDKAHHIAGRIGTSKLTETAKSELNYIIEELVKNNEVRFVEFYNKAGPINTRMHQLELLPGIGKRHMLSILEAREEKPFENFEDMKKRVPLLPDPEKAIIKRVLLELDGIEKHYLFVRHQ